MQNTLVFRHSKKPNLATQDVQRTPAWDKEQARIMVPKGKNIGLSQKERKEWTKQVVLEVLTDQRICRIFLHPTRPVKYHLPG